MKYTLFFLLTACSHLDATLVQPNDCRNMCRPGLVKEIIIKEGICKCRKGRVR
jgi:hypothetical protein